MRTPDRDAQAHSADLQMHLTVNGRLVSIGHLGPDYVVLDDPIDHPPSDAYVFLSVDGRERRWRVRLIDGLSVSQPRTRISLPELP